MREPSVGKGVLRSLNAILLGWAAMFGGYLMAITAVGIFDSENLAAGSRLSLGRMFFVFSVFYGSAMAGGFLTGTIARRDEIKHAAGLVLFTCLVNAVFFLLLTGGHLAAPLLNRYTIAAQLPLLPSILIGGWLRARQMARSKANRGCLSRM